MGCGAKAEAKKLGYNISVQGPTDFSAPEQIPIVHSVTATKPAAVMIAPTDVHALIAPMQQMKAAGIKVVQVDTHVANNSIASASISSNNTRGGALAADALAKLIHDKGSVVVMNEQPGVSTTEARIAGFLKEIKKYKNIKVLQTQYTGDSPAPAAQKINALYSANPNLSGVFATNVLVAEGVDTGLKTDRGHRQGEDRRLRRRSRAGRRPEEERRPGACRAAALPGGRRRRPAGGERDQRQADQVDPDNLAVLTKSNLAANSRYIYKSSC